MADEATSKPQLIGLAGTFASGKDTLAKRLVSDFGYEHVSTSEMVRKIALERYGSIERPVLVRTADEERHKRGAGAFVYEALSHPRPLVVSGLRSLGEAKAIKQAGGVLVFVDASLEVRYERMKSRQRDAEVEQSLEVFAAGEQKEWYAGEGDAEFNLRDIKAMADIVVENDLELEAFIVTAYQSLGLTE